MNISPSPKGLHLRLAILALLCLLPCVLLGQASTGYTADLPSVERVKAEIHGSDPTDTLARQGAVFSFLSRYIQDIKYNRTVRGPYTPDEQRLVGAYNLAAYQISQDYSKSHTPEEAKAFTRLQFQYQMNSDFYQDWSHRLIGPRAAAAYHNMEAEMGARQQAHIDSINRANQAAAARSNSAPSDSSGSARMLSDDPTAVKTRRCLELGGDKTTCVGKGLFTGFMDMFGMGSLTASTSEPARSGVVLSGLYHNPNTLAAIDFGPDRAAIQNCGKLVAEGHAYTIRKTPGSTEVIVANEPRPIVLTLRPDGALLGPGPVELKGHIISGYHTVIHGAIGSCGGPCPTSTVADYAPAMARCTVAALAPPRPNPSASARPRQSGILALASSTTDALSHPSEPGLRMTGRYRSSGGLLLEFNGQDVILDCGQAHVKAPYKVENRGSAFTVTIENSGGPFTLALAADNTLRGSGSTAVNGRLVTGANGDQVLFRPHSETCSIGAFSLLSGASSTLTASAPTYEPPQASVEAAASPSPASASLTPAAAPSASVPPAAAGQRAAMRVNIVSQLEGVSLLPNRAVLVMQKPISDVLRELGIPIPNDATPGQAMQTLTSACRTRDCSSMAKAISSYAVTSAKLDAGGAAHLSANAHTGTYFFFTSAHAANGSTYIWDVPANLHAGDNTITLTTANAEVTH